MYDRLRSTRYLARRQLSKPCVFTSTPCTFYRLSCLNRASDGVACSKLFLHLGIENLALRAIRNSRKHLVCNQAVCLCGQYHESFLPCSELLIEGGDRSIAFGRLKRRLRAKPPRIRLPAISATVESKKFKRIAGRPGHP